MSSVIAESVLACVIHSWHYIIRSGYDSTLFESNQLILAKLESIQLMTQMTSPAIELIQLTIEGICSGVDSIQLANRAKT